MSPVPKIVAVKDSSPEGNDLLAGGSARCTVRVSRGRTSGRCARRGTEVEIRVDEAGSKGRRAGRGGQGAVPRVRAFGATSGLESLEGDGRRSA